MPRTSSTSRSRPRWTSTATATRTRSSAIAPSPRAAARAARAPTTRTASPTARSGRAAARSAARRCRRASRREISAVTNAEIWANGRDMAIATRGTASNYLQRAPSPSGLADVVDLILDKGLVIDAYVRVAVIGIELLTIDARIVIASVDTYLRFAEAVNRLDLNQTELGGLPELQQKGAEKMTEGAIEGVEDELTPDSGTVRTALKGAAAAAAIGAATAAAREA